MKLLARWDHGEVEAEAWKLGIPVRTRHNEVAPHQYEVAPIFQATVQSTP